MSKVIKGEITQEDLLNANKEGLAWCDCLLGQSLQRMGYDRNKLNLGTWLYRINNQEYSGDYKLVELIRDWYEFNNPYIESRLPFSYTLQLDVEMANPRSNSDSEKE